MRTVLLIAALALVAVLLYLTFTSDEAAAAPFKCAAEQDMCAIQPVSAPLLDYVMMPADAHWSLMGEKPRCRAQQFLYVDADLDVAARGDMPGCDIYWNRTFLRDTLVAVYDPDPQIAREGLEDLCQVAAHERGHNLGHDHTDSGGAGLMDPDGGEWLTKLPDGTWVGGIIPECKAWARHVVKRRHGHRIRMSGRLHVSVLGTTP